MTTATVDEPAVVDVTEEFPGCIRAARKGVNTLILRRLLRPRRRFDGMRASYELEYRWHRSGRVDVHSVLGNEFTFWQRKEIEPVLSGIRELFDFFQLF